MNIAIDGPSSQQNTIARAGRSSGILYLDTGAMYRAVGLKALRAGIDCHSEEALTELLKQTELDVQLNARVSEVLLDGEDVSDLIRTAGVSQAASDASVRCLWFGAGWWLSSSKSQASRIWCLIAAILVRLCCRRQHLSSF